MRSLRHATLFAAARLDVMLRTRGEQLSRCNVVGAGLLAAAIAAFAQLRGAHVHGGFAGAQPVLPRDQPVGDDTSASGGAPGTHSGP